jgi:hypothetical protein
MSKKSKDWTWKKLQDREIQHSRQDIRPDTMTNSKGMIVRYHCPHPTTPAMERFKEWIRIEDHGYEGECHVFQGSDRFRASEVRTLNPQRFILEECGIITEFDRCRIRTSCKTRKCCRLIHLEVQILA